VLDAFDLAATFATQPLPRGPRVAIVTTAGGWGVLSADAVEHTDLVLATPTDELVAELDRYLPSRWSGGNPIDLAGGETRDTIPLVLEAVATSAAVDSVIVLGLGIQDNQARLEREGPFFSSHELARITTFHAYQDRRYVETVAQLRQLTGKPILMATELSISEPSNAAVRAARDAGMHVFATADRAVAALDGLWRRRVWLDAHTETEAPSPHGADGSTGDLPPGA
jgi:acetyltransferase